MRSADAGKRRPIMSKKGKEYKIDGKPATIYRTVKNKDNPYVMIDRRPVDNKELSFKAKGILTYLMSRPDGWEVSVADLVKHSTDGESSIRSGLKELKDAGHMKYTTSRNEGRITGWLIEVFEVPSVEFIAVSPDSDFQQVENLQVENQDVENRTQVLKTLSNIENKTITGGGVFKLYQQNIGAPTAIIAQKLDDMVTEYGEIFVADAIEAAVLANVRKLSYVEGCCRNWKRDGRGPKKIVNAGPAVHEGLFYG